MQFIQKLTMRDQGIHVDCVNILHEMQNTYPNAKMLFSDKATFNVSGKVKNVTVSFGALITYMRSEIMKKIHER